MKEGTQGNEESLKDLVGKLLLKGEGDLFQLSNAAKFKNVFVKADEKVSYTSKEEFNKICEKIRAKWNKGKGQENQLDEEQAKFAIRAFYLAAKDSGKEIKPLGRAPKNPQILEIFKDLIACVDDEKKLEVLKGKIEEKPEKISESKNKSWVESQAEKENSLSVLLFKASSDEKWYEIAEAEVGRSNVNGVDLSYISYNCLSSQQYVATKEALAKSAKEALAKSAVDAKSKIAKPQLVVEKANESNIKEIVSSNDAVTDAIYEEARQRRMANHSLKEDISKFQKFADEKLAKLKTLLSKEKRDEKDNTDPEELYKWFQAQMFDDRVSDNNVSISAIKANTALQQYGGELESQGLLSDAQKVAFKSIQLTNPLAVIENLKEGGVVEDCFDIESFLMLGKVDDAVTHLDPELIAIILARKEGVESKGLKYRLSINSTCLSTEHYPNAMSVLLDITKQSTILQHTADKYCMVWSKDKESAKVTKEHYKDDAKYEGGNKDIESKINKIDKLKERFKGTNSSEPYSDAQSLNKTLALLDYARQRLMGGENVVQLNMGDNDPTYENKLFENSQGEVIDLQKELGDFGVELITLLTKSTDAPKALNEGKDLTQYKRINTYEAKEFLIAMVPGESKRDQYLQLAKNYVIGAFEKDAATHDLVKDNESLKIKVDEYIKSIWYVEKKPVLEALEQENNFNKNTENQNSPGTSLKIKLTIKDVAGKLKEAGLNFTANEKGQYYLYDGGWCGFFSKPIYALEEKDSDFRLRPIGEGKLDSGQIEALKTLFGKNQEFQPQGLESVNIKSDSTIKFSRKQEIEAAKLEGNNNNNSL